MNKKDYYETLGVSKSASDEEIKSAFKKMAKKYHPDVSQEKDAEAKFKEAQEAYSVLSDKDKKAQYDRFGHQAFNNGSGGFNGGGFNGGGFNSNDFDFGDIFSDIFGSSFGFGGNSTSQNRKRKGRDLSVSMTITFEEAAYGSDKEIEIETYEECEDCDGKGGHGIKTCSKCAGRGTIIQEQRTILGSFQTRSTCNVCGGSGETYDKTCSTCNGKGIEKKKKKIKVNLPAGIDNGNQLRVAGKGEAGTNGGPNGDLYIEFKVKPHEIFYREEDDIFIDLPITITDAILGCKKEIPTLYGNVILSIPPGTQNEDRHRIKGKGIENVQSKRNGDMFVIVKIITPTKLDRNQRDLIKELSETDLENEKFNRYNSYIKKNK